jgi:RNA polymerase sigma-70 factor (ECF subfamily)
MSSSKIEKSKLSGSTEKEDDKVQTAVAQAVQAPAKAGLSRPSRQELTTGMVERCQAGDPVAFRQIFENHVDGVHRHLSLLLGPGADVEDLVQLVFLNVFQSIGRFKGRSAFSTWLFRITVNVARQEIRTNRRRRKLSAAVAENGATVQGKSESTPERRLASRQEAYEILERLSWKKRETYVLYAYEGYSLEEIAALLDSSVSTIGSRLQAARREIIDCLQARRER